MFWKHNYITFSCSALLIYVFLLRLYIQAASPNFKFWGSVKKIFGPNAPTYPPTQSQSLRRCSWDIAYGLFVRVIRWQQLANLIV